MTINKLALTAGAALAAMTIAGAAHAEVTTSASVGGYSDYRLRGVSVNNLSPVMQGDLEIGAGTKEVSGFLGVWASSLDKDAGAGAIEEDLYGGVKGTYEGTSWKLTYLNIRFPDADSDFDQYAGSLGHSFGPVSGTLGIVHDEHSSPSSQSTYYYLSGGYTIPNTPIGLSATLGYEDGDTVNDKINWDLGASYTFQKFKIGVDYIDTNKTIRNASGKDLAGGTALVSVSAAF